MGVLAQKTMLSFLVVAFFLWQQPPAFAGVYLLEKIDFWKAQETQQGKMENQFSSDDLWSSVTVDAQGRTAVQRPPGVVVDLLENPSTDTGQRYWAWNSARLNKLARAEDFLSQMAKEKRSLEGTCPSCPSLSGR